MRCSMKYIIVLGDGMAGEALEELGNKTTLEAANKPTMKRLAQHAEVGMAHMVPEGMAPGSDTANLSVMGYDPAVYYSGRSPIEALSIGVDMKDSDVSLRCNLVTISEEESNYEERTMLDHSSGEITTEEASELLDAVKQAFQDESYQFYVGTSYRHLLIWQEGQVVELTPPHDILTRKVGEYLPKDSVLHEMTRKSYDILKNHPINIKRKEKGLNPANSIWFWGAGTRPALRSFEEKTGKKGAMISAVDLLKGIAVGAGMRSIDVEGATGGLHTNYAGKANAAIDALLKEKRDFVYVHIEAPDEMGHQGLMKEKILAIEYLDEKIVTPIVTALDEAKEAYRIMILPDHPTPIAKRTHTSTAVPYLLYDSEQSVDGVADYNEVLASATGIMWNDGYKLIDHLLEIEKH